MRHEKLTLTEWREIASKIRSIVRIASDISDFVERTAGVKSAERAYGLINSQKLKTARSELEDLAIAQHPDHANEIMQAFYGGENG